MTHARPSATAPESPGLSTIAARPRRARAGMWVAMLLAAAAAVGGCTRTPPRPDVTPVALATGSFTRVWSADVGTKRDPVTELYARGNLVIAYTRNKVAYGIDRASGVTRFVTDVRPAGGVLRPPVVLPERVVYPTATTLEVYDYNGRNPRSVPLAQSSRSGAAGGGSNLVYLGLDFPNGGRVVAVDVTRDYGSQRWAFVLSGGGVSAAPAYFERTVYAADETGRVYAITDDQTNGWAISDARGLTQTYFQTGGVLAGLRADESGVYVASTDQKLYCIDRFTGKLKWQYYSGARLTSTPFVAATTVYQTVPGQGLVAIDKAPRANMPVFNRLPKWTRPDAVRALAEDEQNAYLLRDDHAIVAVDRATGAERFASRTTGAFAAFAAAAAPSKEAVFYAATADGLIVAVRPVLKAGEVGPVVRLDQRPLDAAVVSARE